MLCGSQNELESFLLEEFLSKNFCNFSIISYINIW